MDINLVVSVTKEEVRLTSQRDGLLTTDRNVTTFRLPRGTGIWVGGSGEDLEADEDFYEVPSFGIAEFDVSTSSSALLYYTELAISSAHPDSLPVSELLDHVEVRLEFAGYESIPLELRREFEYRVQQSSLIGQLLINDHDVSWPRSTRLLARGTAIGVFLGVWAVTLILAIPESVRWVFDQMPDNASGPIESMSDLVEIAPAIGGLVAIWGLLFVVVSGAIFALWSILSRIMLPPSLRAAMSRWMPWPGVPMRLRTWIAPFGEGA